MRQYLFDAWHVELLASLSDSAHTEIAAIASKAAKEAAYHLERSRGTVIALGDGTEESHTRMHDALERLWPYVGEMFIGDAVEEELFATKVAPMPEALRDGWEAEIGTTLKAATLTRPADDFAQTGGRNGRIHTEDLGHLLTSMQFLQRAYPGEQW